MARKKLSAYQREKRRVKALKSSMEKRGFIFHDIKFNERLEKALETKSPSSARFLKNLTPVKMQEKSLFLIPETGEVISGRAGRRLERQRAAEKGLEKRKPPAPPPPPPKPPEPPAPPPPPPKPPEPPEEPEYPDEALIVLENLINTWSPLSTWSDTFARLKRTDKNKADNILQGAISDLGREQVARNAQLYAVQLTALLDEILYASGERNVGFDGSGQLPNLVTFATLIRGNPLDLQTAKDITEATESEQYDDEYYL